MSICAECKREFCASSEAQTVCISCLIKPHKRRDDDDDVIIHRDILKEDEDMSQGICIDCNSTFERLSPNQKRCAECSPILKERSKPQNVESQVIPPAVEPKPVETQPVEPAKLELNDIQTVLNALISALSVYNTSNMTSHISFKIDGIECSICRIK